MPEVTPVRDANHNDFQRKDKARTTKEGDSDSGSRDFNHTCL